VLHVRPSRFADRRQVEAVGALEESRFVRAQRIVRTAVLREARVLCAGAVLLLQALDIGCEGDIGKLMCHAAIVGLYQSEINASISTSLLRKVD
jgi:hypothetical protein